LIDPPSRYHPTEVWQRYLDALRRSPQEDPVVRFEIARAQRELGATRPAKTSGGPPPDEVGRASIMDAQK